MAKKLTFEIVKQQIEAIHENITVPIQKYINSNTKIIYICKYHGEKSAKPSSLKKGSGCSNCAHEKQRCNWLDVIKDIESIHENITIPIDQKYIDSKTKIIYICKYHGEKSATPSSLKKGSGCGDCAHEKQKCNWLDVIKNIEAIHENITVPIDQKYIDTGTKILYICKYHGEKSATPSSLKSGNGCIDCGYNNSSKIRNTVKDISLNNIKITTQIVGVSFENRQQLIPKYCRVGLKVNLKFAPSHRHKRSSIEILLNNQSLGFVDSSIAYEICGYIENEKRIIAKINSVDTGYSNNFYGFSVTFHIFKDTFWNRLKYFF